MRFTAHLIAAFGRIAPEVTRRVSLESGWPDAIDDLVDALDEVLPERAALVFDDLHVITDDQTLAALAYLVERLPAPLHVIITTQTRPALSGLHLWHADGRLFAVGGEHLRFRADEVPPFFAARYGISLSPDDASRVHRYCEGWPIAMHLLGSALAAHRAGGDTPLVAELLSESTAREHLDAYLRQHVLARHDHHTQEFLTATALVDDFDQQLADALLGESTTAVLRQVAESGLYLASDGHGIYRYQGWFREFLRACSDPPFRTAIHQRAAEHLDSRGRGEEAVTHFAAAGDLESAARMLDAVGPALVRQGQHMRLLALSEAVPEQERRAHHRLALARSDALRYACRYAEALEEAQLALDAGETSADPADTFAALERIAQVHLDTVRPALAADPLLRMRQLLADLDESYRARWVRLAAENDLNSGALKEAAHSLRDSGHGDDQLLSARLDARIGDLAGALGHLGLAPPDQRPRSPRSHREKDALQAWVHALQGNADAAQRHALRGIETGKVLASPIIECVCTGRAGLALLSSPEGDVARAVELLRASLELARSIDVPRFRAEGLIGLTVARGRQGDWAAARQCGTEALQVLKAAGDAYLAALAALALGSAAARCRHPEAERWLSAASTGSASMGEHYIGTLADLWLAQDRLWRDQPAEGCRQAERALRAMRDHSMDYLLTNSPWTGFDNDADWASLAALGLSDTELAPYARYLIDARGPRSAD
ncbi:MAG: hypothetical protein ACRDQF_02505, partial [Thermocrispum sp.]